MGRRVLITGLGTFWGGRLAQALERDPDIEVIIGLDTEEPKVRLERTEYVRSDENYSILSRIVAATKVDTIVHTFLVVDSTQTSGRRLHEINVIGTMNLFAAAATPASTVRNVVVKSSALVYGTTARDPVWFTETTPRKSTPRTGIERSLLEVEGYVRDFAVDNPHVEVTLLRFSNVLGPKLSTPFSKALRLPAVPSVFGFDPRLQLIHEDDVVRSLLFSLGEGRSGIYNVAGDGLVPWSEIARICGKATIPLPFLGTNLAAEPLRRVGVDIPPELLDLLRFGRGIDNRRLKEAGFEYRYTTAGAAQAFVEAVRLRQTIGNHDSEYRYEEDVEAFFRHSPAVVRDGEG
ncbi:NAD-dependent epimerase/dehydratase family protein [Iamia sp.]|uniref:NAD-dependent epimerase/dehydratase family protein n=1 Tax=Iamia sp. TaxID=2722710 RepID=UPI002C5DE409|nr:NAD-dependent epimerase/dehydratase family protein [Iamia sp.]HXH59477.1 NAD-dependent epimerase/dehydratase family protein [Iamia sp.]